MIQKREVAVAIILSIITCGIYGIYWFIKLNDEINALDNDTTATTGGMAFLFTLITCGIYELFWMYKMGDKLDSLSVQKGYAQSSRGILYLILAIFGLGIVSYALMQDTINKLIER